MVILSASFEAQAQIKPPNKIQTHGRGWVLNPGRDAESDSLYSGILWDAWLSSLSFFPPLPCDLDLGAYCQMTLLMTQNGTGIVWVLGDLQRKLVKLLRSLVIIWSSAGPDQSNYSLLSPETYKHDHDDDDSKSFYNATCIVPSIFPTWTIVIFLITVLSSCFEYQHVIDKGIRHKEIK